MKLNPTHFVAVIGGAVAGSEAAFNLGERGIKVVVFDQNPRPYGKVEDGLPKWHVKLRAKEELKIDEKLSHPNVLFVPNIALGRDINIIDLVKNWAFSAILLANGVWRDRPLPIDGIDEFIGKGLVYQNDFLHWFNHYHESDYEGDHYQIPDSAIIIGGGLASLDVVKIVMLETVLAALKKLNIKTDILELEHESISKVLDKHNLTLQKLGLQGCTLFYRRRIIDMPLAQLPQDASPETREKIYSARKKIMKNFQKKYLFKIQECRVPYGIVTNNSHLSEIIFSETEIINNRVEVKNEMEHKVLSPLVISSVGSIPVPIKGIDMKGELYDLSDQETGQLKQFNNVFALGNVVTGKGNIKASSFHGKQVATHVLEQFLAWSEDDYEKVFQFSSQRAKGRVGKITNLLNEKNVLSVDKIKSLIEKVESYQRKVGYNGNYAEWISKHKVESIVDVISEQKLRQSRD
jgi:Pyridine nucleotide-disulphide oxidoreductase